MRPLPIPIRRLKETLLIREVRPYRHYRTETTYTNCEGHLMASKKHLALRALALLPVRRGGALAGDARHNSLPASQGPSRWPPSLARHSHDQRRGASLAALAA